MLRYFLKAVRESHYVRLNPRAIPASLHIKNVQPQKSHGVALHELRENVTALSKKTEEQNQEQQEKISILRNLVIVKDQQIEKSVDDLDAKMENEQKAQNTKIETIRNIAVTYFYF